VIESPYLDWDTELAGEVVDSNHYGFHVGAITSFGLHAKSKFAAELAYRDMQIEQKDNRIAELEADKAEFIKHKSVIIAALRQSRRRTIHETFKTQCSQAVAFIEDQQPEKEQG
jgi:cytochrome c-type biogenesis protein CcmH/NrfG